MTRAVAYIRQSRRADLDVALSPEQQRRDVETLATRDGCELSAVYEDLGRSGARGKERLRTGYQDLIADLQAGGVGTLYTKTLTRLGRSVTELYRVLQVAEDQGCRIVTMKEGVMDPRTPIGKAQFGMLAVFAEFERDLAVERARDNVASRRARGEAMGRRTYGTREGEDPQVVLTAFREAGSYNGACRALNLAGVPTVLGRAWSPTAVRDLVLREAPDLAPVNPQRGSASRGTPLVLNGLLQCPGCGGILTGSRDRGGKYSRYHCHRAPHNPQHQRPSSIAESKVLPWLQGQVGQLQLQGDRLHEEQADTTTRLTALADRRARVLDLYELGASKAEVAARLALVDAEIQELEATTSVAGTVFVLPPVDELWTWDPSEVNRLLRLLVHHVELDANLAPVRVHWRGNVADWAAA